MIVNIDKKVIEEYLEKELKEELKEYKDDIIKIIIDEYEDEMYVYDLNEYIQSIDIITIDDLIEDKDLIIDDIQNDMLNDYKEDYTLILNDKEQKQELVERYTEKMKYEVHEIVWLDTEDDILLIFNYF